MKIFFKKVITYTKTPQGFFSCVTLLFGIVFILIVPPLQTPDEAAHFLRGYQVAHFDFRPETRNGITGSYIPTSFVTFQQVVEKHGALQTHPNVKYNPKDTKAALEVPLNKQEKIFMDTSVTATYSPVGYIPQAVAIGIGSIVNAPPLVMLYMARLFVLITWTALVYVSIKIFPYKKWAVVGIALLPMLVAQSMSLGVDVIAVGAGILFTSAALACVQRQATRKLILILVCSGIAMILSKQIMIFLLGLLFAIPSRHFSVNSKKAWFIKLTLLFVPIILFGIWSMLLPDISANVTQLTNDQNTSGQISHILHHPWSFVATMFHTFFFTAGDGIWTSLMGNFGWIDTPLSGLFINLGYVSLFFYWFVNYENAAIKPLMRGKKIIFAFVALLYFIGVCGALYVLFSPVAFPIIVGVQGRYLFPCLFLLVPVFFSRLVLMPEKYYVRVARLAPFILLFISTITIAYRYYLIPY